MDTVPGRGTRQLPPPWSPLAAANQTGLTSPQELDADSPDVLPTAKFLTGGKRAARICLPGQPRVRDDVRDRLARLRSVILSKECMTP
jgi:hypothetical protein